MEGGSMATLHHNADWTALLDRAVDDLLQGLADDTAREVRNEYAAPSGEHEDVASLPQFDIGSSVAVRQRLVSYSATLLMAASASTGDTCSDGEEVVDCRREFHPDSPPVYRCLHSPPHCYDNEGHRIACP
jgi:hypothetical protein